MGIREGRKPCAPRTRNAFHRERIKKSITVRFSLNDRISGGFPVGGSRLQGRHRQYQYFGYHSVCLFPPSRGIKIIIKTPLPIDCRVATVRWIKKEDESFYLAGLKFIDHFPPS
jgi:hypothetical protein